MVIVRSVSSATVSPENPPWLRSNFGAPRAHAPGHHRNAIQQIERALFQVLAGDVFERLPAREPAIAVAHLHVAGHRADLGIGEMPHQARNRVRRSTMVSASMDTIISLVASRRAVIQRRGLAVIAWCIRAHARVRARNLRAAVRRCGRWNRRPPPELPASDNRDASAECTVFTITSSSL